MPLPCAVCLALLPAFKGAAHLSERLPAPPALRAAGCQCHPWHRPGLRAALRFPDPPCQAGADRGPRSRPGPAWGRSWPRSNGRRQPAPAHCPPRRSPGRGEATQGDRRTTRPVMLRAASSLRLERADRSQGTPGVVVLRRGVLSLPFLCPGTRPPPRRASAVTDSAGQPVAAAPCGRARRRLPGDRDSRRLGGVAGVPGDGGECVRAGQRPPQPARLSHPPRRRAPGPGPRWDAAGGAGTADGRRGGGRGGRGWRRRGPGEGRGRREPPAAPVRAPRAAAPPATPGAPRGAGGGTPAGWGGAPCPPGFYRFIFQIVPAGSGAASPLPAAPPPGKRLPREPGS